MENQLQLNLDLTLYPEFIPLRWIMEKYNITRPTVINWIGQGILPNFSTPPASRKPGWIREQFVGFIMGKSIAEGQMAAESGIYKNVG